MEKEEREKQGSVFRLSSLQYYVLCAQYHPVYVKKTKIQTKTEKQKMRMCSSSSAWSFIKQCVYLDSCRFPYQSSLACIPQFPPDSFYWKRLH